MHARARAAAAAPGAAQAEACPSEPRVKSKRRCDEVAATMIARARRQERPTRRVARCKHGRSYM